MLSEQQKRERKLQARIARNRQAIEAEGFTREEAERLAANHEFIREHNRLVLLTKTLAISGALGRATPQLIALVQRAVR